MTQKYLISFSFYVILYSTGEIDMLNSNVKLDVMVSSVQME